jgi:predicted aldo/keto reductase-like oxidoreductase
MNPSDRPVYFDQWEPLWKEWEQWLYKSELSPLQACISFVLSNPNIDRVVVGVESLYQLQEILSVRTVTSETAPDKLCCDDPDLINPARWQLT